MLFCRIVLFVLAALVCAFPSQAQDTVRTHPMEHGDGHDEFFKDWKDKDGKGCCNENDCQGVEYRQKGGTHGQFYVPDMDRWFDVDPKKIIHPKRQPSSGAFACFVRHREIDPELSRVEQLCFVMPSMAQVQPPNRHAQLKD